MGCIESKYSATKSSKKTIIPEAYEKYKKTFIDGEFQTLQVYSDFCQRSLFKTWTKYEDQKISKDNMKLFYNNLYVKSLTHFLVVCKIESTIGKISSKIEEKIMKSGPLSVLSKENVEFCQKAGKIKYEDNSTRELTILKTKIKKIPLLNKDDLEIKTVTGKKVIAGGKVHIFTFCSVENEENTDLENEKKILDYRGGFVLVQVKDAVMLLKECLIHVNQDISVDCKFDLLKLVANCVEKLKMECEESSESKVFCNNNFEK